MCNAWPLAGLLLCWIGRVSYRLGTGVGSRVLPFMIHIDLWVLRGLHLVDSKVSGWSQSLGLPNLRCKVEALPGFVNSPTKDLDPYAGDFYKHF